MKEVALYDAKNGLSALIQQIEETGEEILITRHGKPAAKLVPAENATRDRKRAAFHRLLARQKDIEVRHPDAEKISAETLKRWGRDEEDDA